MEISVNFMAVLAAATIFGDKNIKLLAVDSGHQLASLLIMGAVLGYLG